MRLTRSGLAIAAGFVVFSLLFSALVTSLNAAIPAAAAGLFAGYLTAKIAASRELAHGGITAGLVAAWLVARLPLPLGARVFVATLAVVAITAGAWIRANARIDRPENLAAESQGPDARSGEERS